MKKKSHRVVEIYKNDRAIERPSGGGSGRGSEPPPRVESICNFRITLGAFSGTSWSNIT